MHEMTVVVNIVDTVDEYAETNNIPEVSVVVVQVGGLTGVLPRYVEMCWEAAIDHSRHLKKSSVTVMEIPGIGRCMSCGTKFKVPECKGVCPDCESINWEPILGKDVLIKEIYVE